MSRTVHVNLGERGYDIRIGSGLGVGEAFIAEEGGRALIVSDSNVDKLHGDRCERDLRGHGLLTTRAVVPAGEESKSLGFAQELYGKALSAGLDRHAVIVALGGGMVGDLAGFVAATFLRGVRLLQVPTTLLAMVDSSVGGKTAVNLPEGKNLVGAFHQPSEVLADLTTLRTLPEREFISGLAEVVKYGVIWDGALFGDIEENVDALRRRDMDVLARIVSRCCEIKAEVVAMDEKESGVRAILNFGHTLGHALEKESGYGKWRHGEAVSLGMVFAAAVSVAEKRLPEEERGRLRRLLAAFGLPVRPAGAVGWESLRAAMAADKKTVGGIPRFVLAERLGSVVLGCEVSEERLRQAFESLFEEDGCVSSE